MKYLSYTHYFTWRHWALTYALLVIFSFSPLICVVIGTALGQALGCENMNEAEAPQCPGGEVLYTILMMGWFGLLTFPFGMFLGILLIIANLLWYFTRKSGQDRL